MTMTDPIADYLTRLRNAILAQHETVDVPVSRFKIRMSEILKAEGYIEDFTVLDDRKHGVLNIQLKWAGPKDCAIQTLTRESRPGRRVYVKATAIPSVRNGHGVAILSTSRGLVTDRKAREMGVGGEYVCSIF